MARFRLSRPAQVDVAHILDVSAERWGSDAKRRYAATFAAMRKVAAAPEGPTTRARAELAPGLRSFHIRYARGDDPNTKVGSPVHILYYRVIAPQLIEIVRVLHERMEPSRQLRAISEGKG
jgi:toxin ParE1/3/4